MLSSSGKAFTLKTQGISKIPDEGDELVHRLPLIPYRI
jgi:hypothetical protein